MMFCWINTEISPQHDSNIKICLQHLQQLILSCVRKRLACNYCRGIRNVSLRSYSLILHASTPSTFLRSACVCWQSEKMALRQCRALRFTQVPRIKCLLPVSSWLCLSEHSREKLYTKTLSSIYLFIFSGLTGIVQRVFLMDNNLF